MSNAISGVGAVFRRGNGASAEAFTALAEVRNITGPGFTRDFIEVTNLDSTGGWREFITGFRDGGTITCLINYTLAVFNTLFDDFNDDDSVNYQISMGDDSMTLDVAGYVTDMPLTIAFNDAVTIAVTFKVTGEPTLSSTGA